VNPTRTNSIATGALFVAATLVALGAAALDPTLSGKNYLTAVAHHPDRLAASVLLYLAAAGTSAGIAIALYPVLKGVHATLALGSVIFRAIECALYAVAAVSLLSIVPLGQEFATASPDSQAPIHTIANSMLSMRDHATLAGVLAFSIGSLMYYTVFYRSRLVPKMAVGLGDTWCALHDDRLPASTVQRQPRHRLHGPDPSHRCLGDGVGALAHIQGLRPL
jgi:hypothetical protein